MTRKPRQPKQHARTINIILPTNEYGQNGVIRITVDGDVAEYYIDRTDAPFGDGFMIEKIGLDVTEHRHMVCLAGADSVCTCKAFEYRGKCRHVDGLLALRKTGKL